MVKKFRISLLMALTLLILAGRGNCGLLPEAFWNWGGPQVLSLAQSKVNGKITAREISGNPLTGFTFKGIVIAGPHGEEMLTADRLEVRVSLASITSLHPVIARLALYQPRFYLVQEKSGQWNVSRLLQKEGPPPEKPSSPGVLGFFLRELDFSEILLEKGTVSLTRGGVTQLYTHLDLKASLTLSHVNQPDRKITVKRADLGITTPQGRLAFNTRLTYSPRLVQIDALALKLADHNVLTVKGEVCEPLKKLTCKLTGQVGPLKGVQIHGFWARWPAPWDLGGKFNFRGAPQGLEVNAQGQVGQARFHLQGQLDHRGKPPTFHLDFDLHGLATAQLREVKDLKVEKLSGLSPVNARLRLEGTGLPWNPQAMKAHLELEPFHYNEVKMKQFKLTLKGDAQSQELQAQAQGNFGSVTVKSKGQLLPLGKGAREAAGDLTLKVQEFQPALLGLANYQETLLNGSLTGSFRLPAYSLAQAHLRGKLEASGRLAGEPLRDFRSRFALEGRKLQISEAKIHLAALEATVKGTISESDLDVRFAALLSGPRPVALPRGTALGYLRAAGAVTGPWKAPQLTLTASGKKVTLAGVSLDSLKVSANLAGWPPQSGNLQLNGVKLHTPAGDFARFSLCSQGTAGRWQFQLGAASAPYPRLEVVGAADLRERPLVLRVDRISWQDQARSLKNVAPFQIRLFPGWQVSPATFQINGGQVTLQVLVRDQELGGRLEARDLPADLLKGLGVPARGKINGQVTLTGTPGSPSLTGDLTLAAGKIKRFPIKTLTTTLNYRSGHLKAAGFLEEDLQHSRLTWKGMVPLRLSLKPLKIAWGDEGLDFRVQSERVDLALLKSLSLEVQDAAGPVEILVEARGNPRQPQVSGHVRWSGGSLQLRQAGTPYKLLRGEIRLQGDRVVIPGIVLESDGTFRLTGEVILSGPPWARAQARLDNFQLVNRGGNELWGNGSVSLSGPLSALVAQGRLVVPKATFRTTFFRTGTDPEIFLVPRQPQPQGAAAPLAPYQNMRIDVTIEAARNVWLKDPIADLELTAGLRVIKTPGQELMLGGLIRALKGTVDVHEKPFKVERASLSLPGKPHTPIIADVKATHEMEGITLILTVAGTITNPQIHLESLPPLPPADVLAYLVFGAPAATLTKEQYYALGAQSLGVLGGVTSKKINEILGQSLPFLKDVKVKSGMTAGRPGLGVEKKITKNVSVSYEHNLNEERGQYEDQMRLQYKINRNLSVESEIGRRNSGADVFFNYDF